MTHQEFVRKYPELRCFPEFIIGRADKSIRLMDATVGDVRHYAALVQRRIHRRERLNRLTRRRVSR